MANDLLKRIHANEEVANCDDNEYCKDMPLNDLLCHIPQISQLCPKGCNRCKITH